MIRFGRRNGVYPEFSNFHNSPVVYDGVTYRNNECGFQAQKTLDKGERLKFCELYGNQAKQAGRRVLLRSDWESIKYGVMVDLCYDKFNRDEKLKDILLSTGNQWIVEDTTGWHDNTWGVCSCHRCKDKWSSNLLGRALMIARSKIRGDEGVPVSFVLNGKEFNFNLDELPKICEDNWYDVLNKINRYAE